MTVLSLADARASLSKHIESAATTHERFEITRNGTRIAVLLSADDYDSLVETVDVLSSPDDVAALATAIAELDTGEVSSADEVRAALVARGRLAE
jgi:prevent-host-death family protein